jgi:hypothetical protein
MAALRRPLLFVAALVACAYGTSAFAQGDYRASPAYQKNLVLLNRGVTEKNWPFVVERSLEVLSNVPNDPAILKVVGFAFRGLGRPQLAAAAFRASGLLGTDNEVDGVFGAVARAMGEVVVIYEHAPPNLVSADPPSVMVRAAAAASTEAQNPAVARLTPEGLKRFNEQVAELAQRIGSGAIAVKAVEGDRVTYTFRDIIVPEEGAVADVVQLNDEAGCQSLAEQVTVRPRETATVAVTWATLKLPDLKPTDALSIDAKKQATPSGETVGVRAGKHDVAITRDGLKAATTVDLAPGATVTLTYESLEGTVHLVGLSQGDRVLYNAAPLAVEANGDLRLPQGSYSLVVERATDTPAIDVKVEAGRSIQIGIPARITVESDVADVRLEIGGSTADWNRSGTTYVRYVSAMGPLQMTASSPRHLPKTYPLDVKPGGAVEVRVPVTDLTINDAWDRYYATKTKRTWGYTLLGVGGASAVTAGVLLFLSSSERSKADDAYGRYQRATDLATATAEREATTAHNSKSNTYKGAGIGMAVAGALALGGATWLLVAYPAEDEPQGSSSGVTLAPWIDATSCGLALWLPAFSL